MADQLAVRRRCASVLRTLGCAFGAGAKAPGGAKARRLRRQAQRYAQV